jgi:mannose/fructose/N-acetylgalactosamine-specific phosphotransferase system component IIB
LTPEDVDYLVKLDADGVEISARDLPDAHRVPLETLLHG